jgi:hypothetical protein
LAGLPIMARRAPTLAITPAAYAEISGTGMAGDARHDQI